MFRYIIGITFIAALLMIVRVIIDGKIRRKLQYALWLIIPVYMILSPFLRINVPVSEEVYAFFPSVHETVVDDMNAGTDRIAHAEQNIVFTNTSPAEPKTVYNGEKIASDNVVVRESPDVQAKTDWYSLACCIVYSVSALIIAMLAVYNLGFLLFCRRNRRFIAKDPVSGLKIFGIDYMGTPFLLFNRIYVDNLSKEYDKYVIRHEASHYKHGDHVWIIIRYLVLAFNWYNPVIWAAFIQSGKDCELACDEEVINYFGEGSSSEYAETLFGMMTKRTKSIWGYTVSTGMKSDYKTIRKRIVSIKKPVKKGYKAFAASLAVLLLFSSCSVVEPVQSKQILKRYGITIAPVHEPEHQESSAVAEKTSGIKWSMDDIQMLNDISNASVYSVTGDLADSAVNAEIPAGYTNWNGNATTLYSRGFYANMVIGRDTYAHTANSQKFIDIKDLPDEIIGYAEGYDLLNTVESEEYPHEAVLDTMLDVPGSFNQYTIRHLAIRQQVDGIPTMPLRGNINTLGGKMSYGDHIKQGGTWTFSQSPVGIFDGETAVQYLLIPKLEIKEIVAEDQDVIPFEKVKNRIKGRIQASVIGDGEYGLMKNKLEDVTVTAAEVCYIMIYDNYEEPDKSSNCYLVPFWAVYYKCGIESGLTQQGAVFFPAVDGIYE